MLAIYGKTPPMSFKIRQRVFDDQKNILDRYALPAPVHNRNSVYDEIQRQYNMSRRDYMAEKQYQRFLQETKIQERSHLTKKVEKFSIQRNCRRKIGQFIHHYCSSSQKKEMESPITL